MGSEMCIRDRDIWILNRLSNLISDVTGSMDKMRLREALHHILYGFDSELQWYLKRTTAKKRNDISGLMHKILSTRVSMLSPFAPHITEEMWEQLGNTETVSKSTWPIPETQENNAAVQTERLLSSTMNDIERLGPVSYTHLTLPTKRIV